MRMTHDNFLNNGENAFVFDGYIIAYTYSPTPANFYNKSDL